MTASSIPGGRDKDSLIRRATQIVGAPGPIPDDTGNDCCAMGQCATSTPTGLISRSPGQFLHNICYDLAMQDKRDHTAWADLTPEDRRLYEQIAAMFSDPLQREAQHWETECRHAIIGRDNAEESMATIASDLGDPMVYLSDRGYFEAEGPAAGKLIDILRDARLRQFRQEECMRQLMEAMHEMGERGGNLSQLLEKCIIKHDRHTSISSPKLIALVIHEMQQSRSGLERLRGVRGELSSQVDFLSNEVRTYKLNLDRVGRVIHGMEDSHDPHRVTGWDVELLIKTVHEMRRLATGPNQQFVRDLLKLFPDNPSHQPGLLYDPHQWLLSAVSSTVGQLARAGEIIKVFNDAIHRMGLSVIGVKRDHNLHDLEVYTAQEVLDAVTALVEKLAAREAQITEQRNLLVGAANTINMIGRALTGHPVLDNAGPTFERTSAIELAQKTNERCAELTQRAAKWETLARQLATVWWWCHSNNANLQHGDFDDPNLTFSICLLGTEWQNGRNTFHGKTPLDAQSEAQAYMEENRPAPTTCTCTCTKIAGPAGNDPNCPVHGQPVTVADLPNILCNCGRAGSASWMHKITCPQYRPAGHKCICTDAGRDVDCPVHSGPEAK